MAFEDQLLKRFTSIKTLPHVALRLSKLISDESITIRDLEEVIRLDPTLVLRLLRVVNSPYYGLKHKVDSIARAVVFLGMKNLRNMVVTEALKDIFKIGPNEDVFSRRKLWLHSAAVSICSRMISERIFEQKGEDVFLCGILHDIGMIVEEQVATTSFIKACEVYQTEQKPFTACEREIIGTDHCAIGYALALDWKLPVDVQEGIRLHHRTVNNIAPDSLPGMIQLSEFIVSRSDYPAMPGMKAELSPSLTSHLNENLDEYKALARDLPDEMTHARDLYEHEG
jgi:HD-like signal output (HDOD) protein